MQEKLENDLGSNLDISYFIFQISNTCFDFFSSALARKQQQIFEIRHIRIDELPRTK